MGGGGRKGRYPRFLWQEDQNKGGKEKLQLSLIANIIVQQLRNREGQSNNEGWQQQPLTQGYNFNLPLKTSR